MSIRARRAATARTSGGRRVASVLGAAGLATMILLAPAAPGMASDAYHIGPGDVLHVTIYAGGEKQEEFTGPVSALGTLTSPLLGEVRMAGQTTYEAERALRDLLAKDYYVDPQVLVSVKEYGGQVFVMGAVKRPGAYGFQERMTVLGACLQAEGFTEFAAPRRVKVSRMVEGRQKVIEIDLVKVRQGKKEDLALMRGDRIDVPRRRF